MNVTMSVGPDPTQVCPVDAIKAIRSAADLDLRGAKPIVDNAMSNVPQKIKLNDSRNADKLSQSLEAAGFELQIKKVKDFEDKYGQDLRGIASVAILSGDEGIASDLIAIIEKYLD